MNRNSLRLLAIRSKTALVEAFLPLTGTQQTAEDLAVRWFMRLTALRFLDANGWLPDQKRLFPCTSARILRLCRTLAAVPALESLFGELLPFPDDISARGSVFLSYLMQIPAKQWRGFPELLGWMYQFQNTTAREEAFRQPRIPLKLIPAATQMFTPDWIVPVKTQKALAALCDVPADWEYCIPEAPQLPAVQKLLHEHKTIAPADLRVIDPCMGTGHILAYVFDALMELHLREGTAPNTAAVRILEHTLCGLDLDANACALAAFVLLMKARQHDAAILDKPIRLHLLHFDGIGTQNVPDAFANAQVFGSLLRPSQTDVFTGRFAALAELLNGQYEIVITNPPYMSSSSMAPVLSEFIRQQYPDSKSDLFAAFMERCTALTAPHGCCAMITQHSWMFLSSYEKLRQKIQQYTMRSLVHLGSRAFAQTDVGIVVQTAAFVCMGRHVPDYRTTYLRLTDAENKERAFFQPENRYICTTGQFSGIAGEPVCYWLSDRMRQLLQKPRLGTHCTICQGMTTSDNSRFLRLWYEVTPGTIAFGCADAKQAAATGKRWFPYNKGGFSRRWYGNHTHVVNFQNNGEEMRQFHAELNKAHSGGRIKNEKMYFQPAVTWTFITESNRFSVRIQPEGFLFDVSGSCLFSEQAELLWQMGFLSSKAAQEILRIYNPTLNFQVENIAKLPYLPPVEEEREQVERLVLENIDIARAEWDCYEMSWDFRCHPLIRENAKGLADAFALWTKECRRRLQRVQRNETALNRIFLRLCGLDEELSASVRTEELTLRSADKSADIRSFLRFAVGCMFGRYSIPDYEGLAENFLPEPAFLPELERFLTAVYGADMLEDNLRFIADALGETREPRAAIVHYFGTRFYTDHCRSYRQRPVYWMADSGKRHECRGLMYLHRMDDRQILLLRRYADEHAAQITAALQTLEAEKKRIPPMQYRKQHTILAQRMQETHVFRMYLDDLRQRGVCVVPDDGVQQNYKKFQSILARMH